MQDNIAGRACVCVCVSAELSLASGLTEVLNVETLCNLLWDNYHLAWMWLVLMHHSLLIMMRGYPVTLVVCVS